MALCTKRPDDAMAPFASSSRRRLLHLRRPIGFLVLTLTAAVATLVAVPGESAEAAFPGVAGRIAYSSGGPFPEAIWTANADGSAVTQLADGRNPSFSPDGTRIAFERWMGSGSDVLVMNADGSGEVRLAAGALQYVSDTRWEEDYETELPPSTIPFVKVVTTTSTARSFQSPAFSPDGSQLAVSEVLDKYAFTLTCAVAEAGGEQCIPEGEPGAYVDSEVACVICTARIVAISSTRVRGLLTSPNLQLGSTISNRPTRRTASSPSGAKEALAFRHSSSWTLPALRRDR